MVRGVRLLVGGLVLLAPSNAGAVSICGGRIGLDDPTLQGSGLRKIDDFAVNDVTGGAGVPIALSVKSSDAEPNHDLFVFAGAPKDAKFSVGGQSNNIWIVSRKDLPSLAITLPKSFSGTITLAVTRVATPLRPERVQTMRVTVAEEPAPQTDSASLGDLGRGVRPHVQTPEEKLLFDRACGQLQRGDVAGARALFEYLVSKGDAAAALALGESYDPRVLSKIYIKGVEADEAKALSWYRKAQQLGSPQARAHLDVLGSK